MRKGLAAAQRRCAQNKLDIWSKKTNADAQGGLLREIFIQVNFRYNNFV
jgi:hypothetical protein